MSQPTGETATETGKPEPTTEPTATEAETDSTDWKAEAEKWKALARKNEGNAKSNAAAAQEAEKYKQQLTEAAKALGLVDDDEDVNTDEVTQRLVAERSERFAAQVETHTLRAASRLGIDADAALDSNRFMDDFADALNAVPESDPKHISNLNPRSREWGEAVEAALNAALEKNPRFKSATTPTGPRPDPSQGARGSSAPGQLTREDVKRLAKEGKHSEIEKARLDGRLADLMSGKR